MNIILSLILYFLEDVYFKVLWPTYKFHVLLSSHSKEKKFLLGNVLFFPVSMKYIQEQWEFPQKRMY